MITTKTTQMRSLCRRRSLHAALPHQDAMRDPIIWSCLREAANHLPESVSFSALDHLERR